jgi:hypothetical protein
LGFKEPQNIEELKLKDSTTRLDACLAAADELYAKADAVFNYEKTPEYAKYQTALKRLAALNEKLRLGSQGYRGVTSADQKRQKELQEEVNRLGYAVGKMRTERGG